jgi:hypothetical protein
MKHEILPNGNLRLIADNPEELTDADTIEEVLDTLLANSDLCWIDPFTCGDLTDAPILAILDYPEQAYEALPGNGRVGCGFWEGKHWSRRVAMRWGWMGYAVKDLLEELRARGEAILLAP